MRPIRQGDSGSAVEDVQRRLRTLGYDLGRAGIDGMFLGATSEAVAAFQRERGLVEDGFVGDETWSALVDATFTLGDRMLYLRVPHFHGRDVRLLQDSLNILGFACGESDSIFGAYTERAVREFQRNSGLPADGIVGAETVKALFALRHVWEGKDPRSHSHAVLAPARAAAVLAQISIVVCGLDEPGRRVAGRVMNLAIATNQNSRVSIATDALSHADQASIVLSIVTDPAVAASGEGIRLDAGGQGLEVAEAIRESVAQGQPRVLVEIGASIAGEERAEQRAAVALLDAVCVAFGEPSGAQ